MNKNLLLAALMTDTPIAVTDIQKRTITGKVMGVRREGGKGYYLVNILNSNGLTEVCVNVNVITIKKPVIRVS